MSVAPGIFVAVASYMEPLLAGTIADALARADRPARLSFGIAEQAVLSERPKLLALNERIASGRLGGAYGVGTVRPLSAFFDETGLTLIP